MRWGDMDAYGHLNNTIYFRYFEEVRIKYMASVGFATGSSPEIAGHESGSKGQPRKCLSNAAGVSPTLSPLLGLLTHPSSKG